MIVHGRFGDTTGRPYLEAQIVIPSLHIAGLVSFLIDTGADGTVLMPADVSRLKIDYSKLTESFDSVGMGGPSSDFAVDAVFMVADGSIIFGYDLKLIVARPKPALQDLPSLLGRNILNHWRIVLDPTNNHVSAEILSWDHKIGPVIG